MDKRIISIVTPLYNSENTIIDMLNSVLRQTFKYWELIIIDDCSTDLSIEIVKREYKNDDRVKIIQLSENYGPAKARNIGIREAKGSYIAFLDSDDIWMPDKLEKQLLFMRSNNILFSYSSYKLIDENDNDLGIFIPPDKISYYDILKTNPIGCSTVMLNVNKIGKLFMDESLKSQEDYTLWLKILKKINYAYGIKEPLTLYRIRSKNKSVSSNKLKTGLNQWKVYRKIERLPLFKSIWYFSHYVYNGIKKYKT